MRTNAAAAPRALTLVLLAAFPTFPSIGNDASIARTREAAVAMASDAASAAARHEATRERRCERMGRIGGVTRTRCD